MNDLEQSFFDSQQIRETLAMFPADLRVLAELIARKAWRDGALCQLHFDTDLSSKAA